MTNTMINNVRTSNRSDFQWTNKTAKKMYNNADKKVDNMSNASKNVRNTVMAGTLTLAKVAGAGVGLAQVATGVSNDDLQKSMIKEEAMQTEMYTRTANHIRETVKNAVSSTKRKVYETERTLLRAVTGGLFDHSK